MRRLFAFIVVAISLVVATVVGVPMVKNNTNSGTEFDGGYTIMYHLTDNGGLEYSNKTALKDNINRAVDNISERLDVFGISNPDIAVENDSYIRVTVPEVSDSRLETIRYALSNNGKVSITNEKDEVIVENAFDVFSAITLYNAGDSINVAFKIDDVERVKEISSDLASTYTGSSENSYANFIVWLGLENPYTEERISFFENNFTADSYLSIDTNTYSRFKCLSQIAVDSEISEDFTGKSSVSADNIKILNKIIDQSNYSFTLNEVYTSKVGSSLSEKVPTNAIIATAVAVLLICILMIVFYRLAGVASSLSIIVYAVSVLAVYNLFGGLFGIESIISILAGLVVAVDANVVVLERIKDEIRKGKSVARSYEEGSKKSVSTVLDCNVLIIISAFALYLFGNQIVKSFSSVLIISQVAIMIVVILLTRLMLGLLAESEIFENKPELFGVKKDEITDVNNVSEYTHKSKFSHVSFIKSGKLKSIISGSVILVGLVVGLLFQIIKGSAFNYSTSSSSGTRIYFRTIDSSFATKEEIGDFFASEDFAGKKPSKITIEVETINLSEDQLTILSDEAYSSYFTVTENGEEVVKNPSSKMDVYNISVYYRRALNENAVSAIDEYFEKEAKLFYDLDEDVSIFKTNYSCYEFRSVSAVESFKSGLVALAMLALFAFVYLSIRFSFSYAVSAILVILHNELLLFALLAITRLSIGTEAIALGLAGAVLTLTNLTITYDKLRETIAESSGIVWKYDSRLAEFNKALQVTMYGHVFASVSAIVASLIIFIIAGLELTSLSFCLILAILVCAFGSFLMASYIWAFFDGVFAKLKSKRKEIRAKREKNKPIDKNEPKEFVFFGIND